MLSIIRAAFVLSALCTAAAGQTIYPIDRAHILAGATFDLKVEFPGAPPAADLKVTINGEDAAKVLGRAPYINADEDGLGHTAYWIRGAHLGKPGRVTVEASAGAARAAVDVGCLRHARRAARQATSSCSSATACRWRTAPPRACCRRASPRAATAASSPWTTCPTWRWCRRPGTDSIVTDSANAMTAYTTGHKSCVNALGVYCAREPEHARPSQRRDDRRARQAHGWAWRSAS